MGDSMSKANDLDTAGIPVNMHLTDTVCILQLYPPSHAESS